MNDGLDEPLSPYVEEEPDVSCFCASAVATPRCPFLVCVCVSVYLCITVCVLVCACLFIHCYCVICPRPARIRVCVCVSVCLCVCVQYADEARLAQMESFGFVRENVQTALRVCA